MFLYKNFEAFRKLCLLLKTCFLFDFKLKTFLFSPKKHFIYHFKKCYFKAFKYS